MSDSNIRLCVPALTLDADLIQLYEGAFPAAERESVDRLRKMIADGRMVCHRTVNENDELLCFTLVMLASNFAFLSYMATDSNRRSGGVGTKHLVRLLELIKAAHPTHIGLFFEIESTNPKAEVLTEEDRKNRIRRKTFYERVGARGLCDEGVYLTPHYSNRNKEWEGELMAFEFGAAVCGDELRDVILEIYDRCYHLKSDHPLVQKVLKHFRPCTDKCDDDYCAVEAEGRARCTTSGADGKPPAQTGQNKPDQKDGNPSDKNGSSNNGKPSDKNGSSGKETPADEKDCGCLLPNWWRWLISILFPSGR